MEKYFEINSMGSNIKSKIYFKDIRNINQVVISCHGFAGSKDNNATRKLADVLNDLYDDVAVVSFDWPAHGSDVKQKLDLNDCDAYLEAVIDYCRNVLGATKLYSQATSFGGYLVLKYISEHGNPFDKIALRCPAVNMYDALVQRILTEDQVEEIERGRIVNCGYDRKIKINKDFVKQLSDNDILKRDFMDYADDILIMHGNKDELIDYEVDRAFCEDNVIEFITIDGADHRYTNPAKLRECINNIINFYYCKNDKTLSNK